MDRYGYSRTTSNPFDDPSVSKGLEDQVFTLEAHEQSPLQPPLKQEERIGMKNSRVEDGHEVWRDEGKSSMTGVAMVGVQEVDMVQREKELERRAEELKEREQHLATRERELQRAGFQLPNWPMCRPMIFHSIEEDIPMDAQSMVRRAYIGWYIAILVYFMNMAACFSILLSGASNVTTGGTDFGISLMYFVVGIPIAFVFWYRPLYNGVKKRRSMLFVFFFICFGCHLALSAFLAIGIPSSGGGGMINMMQMFAAGKLASGILLAISSGLLILQVLYGLIEIKSVASYFRTRGLSFEQAKREAAFDFVASDFGRDFAKETVLRHS